MDLLAAKDQNAKYITPSQGKRVKLLAINTFIPNADPSDIPLFNTVAVKGGWNKGKTKSVSLHASLLLSAELAGFLSLLLVVAIVVVIIIVMIICISFSFG